MGNQHGFIFEELIKDSCEEYGYFHHRLKTRSSGFKGDTEIADFIVYGEGKLLIIEAKSTKQPTFPFSMIRPTQASGMYQAVNKYKDINAGILLDFIPKNVIYYIPIQEVDNQLRRGKLSMTYDDLEKRAVKVNKDKYIDIEELIKGLNKED